MLFFADLSKLDLLGYVFQGVGEGYPEDPRIQHFHVHTVEIDTKPAMPIMVDGIPIGEGSVQIEIRRHALSGNGWASGDYIIYRTEERNS